MAAESDLNGSLCDYCPTNAKDEAAKAAGVQYKDTPCFVCCEFSHFDFYGLKAKDAEILALKEQVASLQRVLAHRRDSDSEVVG